MTADVDYTEDDTVPLEAVLPVDLTEGTGTDRVEFRLKYEKTGRKVVGDAVILDYKEGRVAYEFDSGDLDDSGIYKMKWVVYWSNGDTESFPRTGLDTLLVHETID